MGKDGGAEAAHRLHSAIKEQVKATYPDAISDWSVVVQVVLNLQGLGTKLLSLGIISNMNELAAFGRAFGESSHSVEGVRLVFSKTCQCSDEIQNSKICLGSISRLIPGAFRNVLTNSQAPHNHCSHSLTSEEVKNEQTTS
jgi:hypothetical protein